MIEKTKNINKPKRGSDLDDIDVNSFRSGKDLEDTPKRKHKKIQSKSSEVKQSQSEEPGEDTESSYGGPSCPKVYEEIIQGLEADVRKHIRMEHQLKLHIETVEDRVEELERELEKIEDSKPVNTDKLKKQHKQEVDSLTAKLKQQDKEVAVRDEKI